MSNINKFMKQYNTIIIEKVFAKFEKQMDRYAKELTASVKSPTQEELTHARVAILKGKPTCSAIYLTNQLLDEYCYRISEYRNRKWLKERKAAGVKAEDETARAETDKEDDEDGEDEDGEDEDQDEDGEDETGEDGNLLSIPTFIRDE